MSTYSNWYEESDDMSNGNLSNQSTEKALIVLEYLVSQPEAVKLLDLSKALGMNTSTVSRFVSALQHCGYVEQDPSTAKYFATMKICELANRMTSRLSIAAVAHPYVQQVSDFFSETACFVVEKKQAICYIDIVVGSSKTLMNIQQVGSSAPLHSTASGKMFLSCYTEEEVNRYIASKGLVAYTPNTIHTRERLLEELEQIRRRGYSIDDNENEEGIRCLAYPIYDYTRKVAGCLSITGPSVRLPTALLEEKHTYLAEVADTLSKRLGYT